MSEQATSFNLYKANENKIKKLYLYLWIEEVEIGDVYSMLEWNKCVLHIHWEISWKPDSTEWLTVVA
jgi:hypothetical protein